MIYVLLTIYLSVIGWIVYIITREPYNDVDEEEEN